MKMTNGEKMVWAAVYARAFQELADRPRSRHATDGDPDWERRIACAASLHASRAVRAAKELRTVLAAGAMLWYDGAVAKEADEMLREVLK